MSTTKDPVCGMAIDPSSAAVTRKHLGEKLYFCSTNCAETFDRNPTQYTPESRQEAHREHQGHRSHSC